MDNIFMMDVESNGLEGEGFCFACVVKRFDSWDFVDSISFKVKLPNYCDWVKQNVLPPIRRIEELETLTELRNEFYKFYMKYKDNSLIFGDCVFPVETNFLSSVMMDDIENRRFNMPYPLYDVANFVDINVNRFEEYERYIDKENTPHNPIHDCEASLYQLKKHKKRILHLFQR